MKKVSLYTNHGFALSFRDEMYIRINGEYLDLWRAVLLREQPVGKFSLGDSSAGATDATIQVDKSGCGANQS